jgi:hypothetical protein
MKNQKYTSVIKKTPYKYYIAKKIADLIYKGLDRIEVYNECFTNNLIQVDSLERRREVTNVIYDRLILLDKYLLEQFLYGDIVTSKFILVYATAKSDSLFLDFLFEVYREALLNEKQYISLDDFDLFFLGKKENNFTVNGWGAYTIDQLGKGYRNILVESGLGKREKRNILVDKILIHPEVVNHIKLIKDEVYLKAILGV